MNNTKFSLSAPGALAVSSADADRLISLGSGIAALLYIYALRQGGSFSVTAAAAALDKTTEEISAAAALLRSAGILGGEKRRELQPPSEEETPEYTAAEIVSRSSGDPDFKLIVEETQHILGHTLSGADLRVLFELYDKLSLPTEVMFLLLNHCTEETRARLGPSARVSMRTIQKEGYYWFNHEIITLERVEEYLRQRKGRKGDIEQVKRALQISGRAYSESEYSYVDSWLEMGFPVEVIALAYDKTVLKTGKLTWRYLDSILQSWHRKGLHTVEAVESGDSRPQQVKPAARPDAQRPVSASNDSARMQRILDMVKNGNVPKGGQ